MATAPDHTVNGRAPSRSDGKVGAGSGVKFPISLKPLLPPRWGRLVTAFADNHPPPRIRFVHDPGSLDFQNVCPILTALAPPGRRWLPESYARSTC